MTLRMKLFAGVAVAAAGLGFAGAVQAADVKEVQMLHWWTSGGEAAALNVLKGDLAKGQAWVKYKAHSEGLARHEQGETGNQHRSDRHEPIPPVAPLLNECRRKILVPEVAQPRHRQHRSLQRIPRHARETDLATKAFRFGMN